MLDAVRADDARAAGLRRRCCACTCGSSVGALPPPLKPDAARDDCGPESAPGELGCCKRASTAWLGLGLGLGLGSGLGLGLG